MNLKGVLWTTTIIRNKCNTIIIKMATKWKGSFDKSQIYDLQREAEFPCLRKSKWWFRVPQGSCLKEAIQGTADYQRVKVIHLPKFLGRWLGFSLYALDSSYYSLPLPWIQCHGYSTMDTVPWIQCHGYSAMDTVSWIQCHGYSAMDTVSWIQCHGYSTMDTVPWIQCHGYIAMDTVPWIHCYGYTAL